MPSRIRVQRRSQYSAPPRTSWIVRNRFRCSPARSRYSKRSSHSRPTATTVTSAAIAATTRRFAILERRIARPPAAASRCFRLKLACLYQPDFASRTSHSIQGAKPEGIRHPFSRRGTRDAVSRGELHKHSLRGSGLDRSALRQEFEQLHKAGPWSGIALGSDDNRPVGARKNESRPGSRDSKKVSPSRGARAPSVDTPPCMMPPVAVPVWPGLAGIAPGRWSAPGVDTPGWNR